MAKLVIVESPAKAKTIGKYLGKNFRVAASVGHVMDLPPKSLGVDLEHDFRPTYEILPNKKSAVANLERAAKSAEEIFLAPDPDREGEAIAWHIAQILKPAGKPMRRVLINEITKGAVEKALAAAGDLNRNLFEAQQARRILDRLVGYLVSPLLTRKFKSNLSAGRVQSVALRLVVDRENVIRAFQAKEYWSVEARLLARLPPAFTARLAAISGKTLELPERFDKDTNSYLPLEPEKYTYVPDAAAARKILEELAGKPFRVGEVVRQERRRNPPPPFITSTLQQEAARKLRFPAKKTMMLAQRLYEGQDVGQGPVGLITYMRTDSPRVSAAALEMVRKYIRGTYGAEYLPPSPVEYKSKKSAQEAHEAIRPTAMENTPEKVKPFLDADMFRLYELIFLRFTASQMKPALYDQTTVEIPVEKYQFRAGGRVMKFNGFLAVYEEASEEEIGPEEDLPLPALSPGEELRVEELKPEQHFTKPPPRFTEAGLVKELEERGIGRPSTYAQILSTIQDRKYVSKNQGRFFPTPLGERVTEVLAKAFPDIFDVGFTAEMEEGLDQIEDGKQNWIDALRRFYGPFSRRLAEAEKVFSELNHVQPTDLACPLCGKELVIKWGKSGEFLGCAGFPECRFTADFQREENGGIKIINRKNAAESGILCERCGRPMVIKTTRKDKREFLACSGYPACKNTADFSRGENGEIILAATFTPENTGVICEQCGKPMVLRKTRKAGREFLACSAYPACRHATDFIRGPNGEIIPVRVGDEGPPCELCGKPLVLRRGKFGVFWACSGYPECKNIRPLAEINTITRKAAAEKTPGRKTKSREPKPASRSGEKSAESAPVCDKCGKPMKARRGKTGAFWGCTGYPECKNTKPMSKEDKKALPQAAAPLPLPEEPPCEKCGKPMVMRQSKYGPFISCSGYPECKNIRRKKASG